MDSQTAASVPLFTSLSDYALIKMMASNVNHYLLVAAAADINNNDETATKTTPALWTADDIALALLSILTTSIICFLVLRKIHVMKRDKLADELGKEQEKVALLEEKLNYLQSKNVLTNYSSSGQNLDGVRVFMDGAFDMMHYGHMNAFRLARSLGAYLIVGVNSDESIKQCKGPPLMNDEERMTMVKGCKFVDEIVPNCPYIMNEEYLNYILKEYNVDYVIHGDDPCIVDGKDVYETAKKAGKFKSIPRTEGVSTTDIVGRMLLMSKNHHCNGSASGSTGTSVSPSTTTMEDCNNGIKKGGALRQLLCHQSNFLTTTKLLRLFSSGMKSPTEGMKIIYIDGDFDMFHPGHVKLLERAKKRGDYLVVGVHGDAVVNQERGCNLPLMNLHERVLSVLGCRFVDDVLIDAPQIISAKMIQSLNIDEVVHCSGNDDVCSNEHPQRYHYAKEAGIYVELPSPTTFNFSSIIDRIQANQASFQAKITRKKKVEEDFYVQKYESKR